MKSRVLKAKRNSLDKQQGEWAREENLNERIAAERRIRSTLQDRIPTPPL
jgi:hypothetical protein